MTSWQDLHLPELVVGDEISIDNITLIPLRLKSDFSAETIVNAQEKEYLEILETDSVNNLKLKAKKGKYFIPFLQVVAGGKQDRMVTRPYIVDISEQEEEVIIPVNCVEQGRWQYSRQSTGENTSTKFRAMSSLRMSSTIGSMNIGAEQRQTWSSIDYYKKERKYARDLSPSMSYMEIASAEISDDPKTHTSKKISDEVKTQIKNAMSSIPEQTGVVLIINDEIRVVELFGNDTIWKEQSEAIINSFIAEIQLDAMEESKSDKMKKSKKKKSIANTIGNLQFSLNKNDKFGTFYTYSKKNLSSLLFLDNKNFVEFYMANSKSGANIINTFSNIGQEQFQVLNEIPEEKRNRRPTQQKQVKEYSEDDFEFNTKYKFKKKE